MSEVQKGFRMPSELAEAVERMAIARGLSFSALVVEALNEKVAGKVPEEAKAAAIEVSDFVKALQGLPAPFAQKLTVCSILFTK
jgi:Ribbon-helix-helix protein, copG family